MSNLQANAQPTKVLMAYYPEWRMQNLPALRVPVDKVTHLLYAFALVDSNGQCATTATTAFVRLHLLDLKALKAQRPLLKVLISIGGWTGSGNFSKVALTAASRQKLVQSCIDLWITGNGKLDSAGVIDGIDIDWEYPGAAGDTNNFRPEDKRNFVLLMAEFRKQFDALSAVNGKTYLLTAALSPDPDVIAAGLDLPELSKYLDYFNLMTYDFHGPSEATGPTNFHNNLFPAADDPSTGSNKGTLNIDSTVKRYIAGGVPPEKIVVGVPYYGRGWNAVKDVNHGLFQPGNGIIEVPYSVIKTDYEPTFSKFRHAEARIPWLYNPDTGVFIAYDDPTSVAEKADYVVNHHLGGIMVWELSMDDPHFSLTTALSEHLRDQPGEVDTAATSQP